MSNFKYWIVLGNNVFVVKGSRQEAERRCNQYNKVDRFGNYIIQSGYDTKSEAIQIAQSLNQSVNR